MLALIDDGDGGLTAEHARARQLLTLRLRARTADRRLAGGTPPERSLLLALRAYELASTGTRHELARTWEQLLVDALQRPVRFGRCCVPIHRERVRAAEPDIRALIQRLTAAGPVAARGVALARLLLGDGAGPLFHPGNTDDLGALVREATQALDSAADW